jgi:hypothetical protein
VTGPKSQSRIAIAEVMEPADQVEQQLPARLRERQAAEFVKDHEAPPAKIIGQAPRVSGAAFGLKLVDLIDNIEEPPAHAAAEAGTGDRDDEMTLRGIEGDLPPVDPGDGQSQRLAARFD